MTKNTRGSKAASSSERFFIVDMMGEAEEDQCFIDNFVQGIEGESWRTTRGERLAPLYPKDARISMSKKYPGIELSSFLGNSINTFIASTDLKEGIEKVCGKADIEYLPFTLYDHRKRPYSKDYFIINPIGTFDCLDFKASDIDWDDENPDEIIDINVHVLDRKKMKDAPQLFRVDRDAFSYVIGLELVRELQKRDITNIVLQELKFSDSK